MLVIKRKLHLTMKYYIYINNQAIGPMTSEQIFAYPVDANTQVSYNSQPWRPLSTYPELVGMLNQRQSGAHASTYGQSGYGPQANGQAHYGQPYYNQQPEVDNKKTLCGIMALLFGTLGVQYFVLGKTAAGFISILLSVLTCGVWQIVTIIQGIMMLCMSDREFREKYVDTTKTFPLF